MSWRDDKMDDAARLLHRARLLLVGVARDAGKTDWHFPPAHNIKTEDANSAILRAAAVLSAAAVNILADELDFRKPLSDEEMEEALADQEALQNEQNANADEAPQASDPAPVPEARPESEAEAPARRGKNRKHSEQTEQEPATHELVGAEPAGPDQTNAEKERS